MAATLATSPNWPSVAEDDGDLTEVRGDQRQRAPSATYVSYDKLAIRVLAAVASGRARGIIQNTVRKERRVVVTSRRTPTSPESDDGESGAEAEAEEDDLGWEFENAKDIYEDDDDSQPDEQDAVAPSARSTTDVCGGLAADNAIHGSAVNAGAAPPHSTYPAHADQPLGNTDGNANHSAAAAHDPHHQQHHQHHHQQQQQRHLAEVFEAELAAAARAVDAFATAARNLTAARLPPGVAASGWWRVPSSELNGCGDAEDWQE